MLTANNNIEPPFFTMDELNFFKKWQYTPYEPNSKESVEVKNQLVNTVWQKTVYLGRHIKEMLAGLALDDRIYWSQQGWRDIDSKKIHASIFKPYTWVKVCRAPDKGKGIYFTFGLEAENENKDFVYKLDYRNTKNSKLSREQMQLSKSLIDAQQNVKWNKIPFDELVTMNWKSLTKRCVDFLQDNFDLYDSIVKQVWETGKSVVDTKPPLQKTDRPKGGYKEFPLKKRLFAASETDYEKKAAKLKGLGDEGERLVIKYETSKLIEAGMQEYAAKVCIQKDGIGYDILSFDPKGNRKYIEVKTTTGGELSPFYLSRNEYEFMKENIGSYVIYRVYNYDRKKEEGYFFEIADDVESQLLMESTNYMVVKRCEEPE